MAYISHFIIIASFFSYFVMPDSIVELQDQLARNYFENDTTTVASLELLAFGRIELDRAAIRCTIVNAILAQSRKSGTTSPDAGIEQVGPELSVAHTEMIVTLGDEGNEITRDTLQRIANIFDKVAYSLDSEPIFSDEDVDRIQESAFRIAEQMGIDLLAFRVRKDGSCSVQTQKCSGEDWGEFFRELTSSEHGVPLSINRLCWEVPEMV